MNRRLAVLLTFSLSCCSRPEAIPTRVLAAGSEPASSQRSEPSSLPVASVLPPAPTAARLELSAYPWHNEPSSKALVATGALDERMAPPDGFRRIDLAQASFGLWLRSLPLASPNTAVKSYAGTVILPCDHANLAAVATLDVGSADLQQCADAVMRLYAEWRWSQQDRDVSFQAASGIMLPYRRWQAGDRIVSNGASIAWQRTSQPSTAEDHASFRAYLNTVFAWANTVSLARQAVRVAFEDALPGDFFVLPGNPGHAVLILDIARDEKGSVALLLGQSYMPAQNFHVLRASQASAWFHVSADAPVKTPFWPKPFPWASLRRLTVQRPAAR